MPALTLLLLLQAGEPGVRTGPDPHHAVRILVTGRIDLHYAYRSGAVNEAGGTMNGAVLETGSTNAWSGRISLRADAEVKDFVTGVIEIENRSFDEGINRPFASDPELDDLDVKQAYIEAGRFLSPTVSLRIGVQDVTFRNRPHDEPFFMDLGESEGFSEGYSTGGAAIRNTADRDVREVAGARLFWTPYEILTLQAFWMVVGEGGGTVRDESIYGAAASARVADAWAAWVLFAAVSAGDPGLEQIGTLGAGVDGYFGDAKELELFAEGYVQRGTLTKDPRRVRKEAWAVNAGVRSVELLEGRLQLEGAVSHRSGNRHSGDGTDEAFQSYENENRFLILQSAEFGLDVDTGVTVVRAGIGAGPFEVDGRPVRFRLDAGKFSAAGPLRAASGARLAGDEDDWGTETDGSVTWSYNESFQLSLQGAWLFGSDLLESLTAGRKDDARILLFGADLKF